MKSQAEFLQEYIFHFNPYTKVWSAFPRNCSNDYFNGIKNDKIISSEDVNHIIEYLKLLKSSNFKILKDKQ